MEDLIMDELSDAFEACASYFGVLSEPMRLRILRSICEQEKSVSEIIEDTGATQTNISRHLNLMHRSGVLARRRDGNQIFYRVADAAMVEICRSVCRRISERMDAKAPLRRDLLQLIPVAKTKATTKRRIA
jgi:DNA-binding transcriptional ArsR family regulator